jgi:hypothetical protein
MKLYKIEEFSQKLKKNVQNFKSISWKTLILSYVSLHGRRWYVHFYGINKFISLHLYLFFSIPV